ncbi:selenocysteine-specific translation elongation factor [Shewanella eurypsychrophilus]|uniref:Selenocysteine-specific elongation factor n=1 Tax=Shewanella eurypsychrophilus TaxID=2593656 RepID=A0ABX6V543_9GAMM|nr:MULTISPECIES: selenocysteine-specific translation elongation factor [Shewanella]QFU22222.1 selenocysteine-specific translation elongation factor [Shewanella sp. YLB-09]QPG57508.1 selenocysteine-specific translation elongation factor [Shewanella eurypsychrophilus]
MMRSSKIDAIELSPQLPEQFVIAMAGHVDHGKTALIHALTGIMTARSFEQDCGMTQNLGFAHFTGSQGQQIGVIDVPGHERYIRNMVAGLWSIELVVLVVAANEGWMPMTQAHLEVAKAMGERSIIICITKKDLVNDEQLLALEEELLERVMDCCDEVAEVICVSSVTGENIEQLKQLISQQLSLITHSKALSVNPDCQRAKALSYQDRKAHLYVDRSFSVTGIGTVVTGSLVGGSLAVGSHLTLMPKGLKVKVRSLQVYHQSVDKVAAVSRVAVGIKGVNYKALSRGDCLVVEPQMHSGTSEIVVRLNTLPPKLKNCQVEVAIGSWHGVGQLIKISHTQLVRVKLNSQVCCHFAQPIAFIQHGGSKLIASGRCVWLSEIERWQRRNLYTLLNALPESIEDPHQVQIQLELEGYIVRHDELDLPPQFEYINLGEFVVLRSWYQQIEMSILSLLNQPSAALSSAELASQLRVNVTVLAEVIQQLKQQDKIHLSYNCWLAGSGSSEDDLCQESQSLLSQIRASERDGYILEKQAKADVKKRLKNLARLKYVTQLEDNIYYDLALYSRLVEDILIGHKKNDRLSMSDIKLRSKLSRKYAIPLANKMERDGWVRRDENDRIVLKSLPS